MRKRTLFLLSLFLLLSVLITYMVFSEYLDDFSTQIGFSIAKNTANVVPIPKTVTVHKGSLIFSSESHIFSKDPRLLPLMKVVSDELFQLTDVRFGLAIYNSKKADITFAIDPSLEKEEYILEIKDRVTVRGGSYNAVAMGSVSLLQMVQVKNGSILFPRLSIHDQPHSSYRGLLVDLARNWHDVETIKQLIVLCRWYKINYMQLHLTDDESFTFPTQAFPDLPTPDRHYTIEQLQELEQFAEERGVYLVPELEAPGHSSKLRDIKPFVLPRLYVINMASEEVYEGLDKIVGEMCDVFKSTLYFHIGADECRLAYVGRTQAEKKFMRKHGLENAQELYNYFIVRMNDIVKKHGKKTLVWEGFRGTGSENVKIPDDITVVAWESLYQLPQSLLNNGYKIINASWKPTYITKARRWDPEYIYGWNVWRWQNYWKMTPSYVSIQLDKTKQVIGAQMCAWEMEDEMEVPSIRSRLPALSERTWNPDAGLSYKDFRKRFLLTDSLYEKLIFPISIHAKGLAYPDYDGPVFNKGKWFAKSLTLTMKPLIKDGQIYYTLDGSTPTQESSKYSVPIELDDTTTVKMRIFDTAGKMLGSRVTTYECRPVKVEVDGMQLQLRDETFWNPPLFYTNSLTISMKSSYKIGQIRYTLHGADPSSSSALYRGKFSISDDTTVKARLFDTDGKGRGQVWQQRYIIVDYQDNITKGKPVFASAENPGYPPESAVDGAVDLENYWSGERGAFQWLKIDLQETIKLNKLHVFPYWRGRRSYRYLAETSIDGIKWTRVADMSKNRRLSTKKGHVHRFKPIHARFIRVRSLKNRINRSLYLIEVRAFKAD